MNGNNNADGTGILNSLPSTTLTVIAALQISCTLAAATVGYVVISLGPTIQSGATFIFPLTYILSDITAEVYGYRVARLLIWLTLACEALFALLVTIIVSMPDISPENQIVNQAALGSVFRFVLSGFVAVVISDFLNIYLLSRWKILVHGQYFCLRSVASTAIASLILVFITIGIAFYGKIPFGQMMHLIGSAYMLELFYAVLFVYPAFFIAEYIKRKEKIDVYDLGTNFNPFKLEINKGEG